MKIVFASSNSGKIHELKALLKNLNIDLVTQVDLGISDIEETGLTFIENAILKARHAAKQSGLPAIADDSGLIVKSLNGAPGIYSARYAGEPSNSKNNIQKLLTVLKDEPDENRAAAFYCSLVFLNHAEDPTPIICEGYWHGTLLKEPRGEMGFGYDPIFFDPIENQCAAELPLTRKNQISHRGQALTLLVNQLKHTFNP